MNKPLSLCLVCALIALADSAPAASRKPNLDAGVRDRLVGAWRLAWLEEQAADGVIHKADCIGLLVYTRDGHMSVQVMYRIAQTNSQAANRPAPVPYAQGGYEASFGTYQIDERAHSFIFHVEGALVRTLIGKELTRVYDFSGSQLIVKSANPDEHWRVAWEHY
jgi:Lipocalin-like domain